MNQPPDTVELDDEIRDARRTIDGLERRLAFTEAEAKRRTEGLEAELDKSRRERKSVQDALGDCKRAEAKAAHDLQQEAQLRKTVEAALRNEREQHGKVKDCLRAAEAGRIAADQRLQVIREQLQGTPEGNSAQPRQEKRPLDTAAAESFASGSSLPTESCAPIAKRQKTGTRTVDAIPPSALNTAAGPSTIAAESSPAAVTISLRPEYLSKLPATLTARIHTIDSIAVHPHPLHETTGYVHRNFLCKTFGIDKRDLFFQVPGERNLPRPSQEDRFVLFPQWATNPG
ncbi:hypothetical protein FA95DRAFT_1605102 [Auriscalpium vulgare]|uniref:Uncharacterized protein n=1 Tax=Auriscalpium vulgare TaxID=40419 RepID=A0ACB8RXT4_9AGAM|nr:hypothetical protein FA95DRAFT_1605102 [Auriscalpium vulgare]